jgi:hypothetical protein
MIPKRLIPKYRYDLIRLGKDNDGGYLVDKNSIYQSDFLLSFGISNDCSFEDDFISLNPNIFCNCYDHSVSLKFWKRYFWLVLGNFLFKGFSFKEVILNYKIYKRFKNFFTKKNVSLINKKIGNGHSNYYSLIPAEEVIKKIIKKHKSIFLKIDIEGSEYDILNDIILYSKYFSGLVIEFHSIHLHLDKILNFINKIDLTLIHLHGNNYADLDINDNPTVIELSFARSPKIISRYKKNLHPLDQKNDPNNKEIMLKLS